MAERAFLVESIGVETIPDDDRTSTPLDLFRLIFGGANTFATILLGTIPIALGLSLGQAVVATVVGVALGALLLAPMSLFGPATGTNNAVASGAFFGIHGRIVGSFLSLLTAIAFYSISVWVSGDAVVGALAKIGGVPDSLPLRTAVYAAIGLCVTAVVIVGYHLMLLINKIAVVANTVLMAAGIFAYATIFDPHYAPAGDQLVLGEFWPTFILSVLTVMANPISFGGFLGDWSRYIPRGTAPAKLMAATFAAQLATLLPFLFGLMTATLVAGSSDYVVELIGVSPRWYALVLILVAFIGGLSTGTTALYGTGLDFSSVIARFSRVTATVTISSLAFVFILVGRLFFDLLDSVNAFVGAIVVMTTPFMVIMILGHWIRRGHYAPDDLQVFNRGQRGGRYWFTHGINWRAMSAWLVAACAGLLFANFPPLVVGPFSGMTGGIDVSLLISIAVATVVYALGILLFPEPSYVAGPTGFRPPARTNETAKLQPILDSAPESQ